MIRKRTLFGLGALVLTIQPANAEPCVSASEAGRAAFSGFSKAYPATLAYVANPAFADGFLRLAVDASANFHPIPRGECRSIRRDVLRRSGYGYIWFVLNNAVATTEGTELGGRSFVIVQADMTYSSGPSWITVSRNTSKSGSLIWERDRIKVGGIRPKVVKGPGAKNLVVKDWNDAHHESKLEGSDAILGTKLHASPAGEEASTWDSREDLLVSEENISRKISNILVSFVVADAVNGGSGVPIQVLLGDLSKAKNLRIKIVSDTPDLNFETRVDFLD
jgi:hypothetical protein